MPQSHSLPPFPSLHCFSHTGLPTCSLFLLPITCSSVLCASCYMSMSLVIKNALWLSHVLVYWIKENPNIIVINTNNIQYTGDTPHALSVGMTFKNATSTQTPSKTKTATATTELTLYQNSNPGIQPLIQIHLHRSSDDSSPSAERPWPRWDVPHTLRQEHQEAWAVSWGVLSNSRHWFTTSFLQPLPYLVTPLGPENCQLTSSFWLVLRQ